MKHEHKECSHENLDYCRICKVVYCKDCTQEWVEQKWNWTYTVPNTTIVNVPTMWPIYADENGTPVRNPEQIITICNHTQ